MKKVISGTQMKHISESITESIIGKRENSNSGKYHIYALETIEDDTYNAVIDNILDWCGWLAGTEIRNRKLKRDLTRRLGIAKRDPGYFSRAEDAANYVRDRMQDYFRKRYGASGDLWLGIAKSEWETEWDALVGYIDSPAGGKTVIVK